MCTSAFFPSVFGQYKIPDVFFHQCFLITLCTHHSRRSPWLQLPRWLSRSDVVVPSRALEPSPSRWTTSHRNIKQSAPRICHFHECFNSLSWLLFGPCLQYGHQRETPLSFENNFRLYFLTRCNVSLFSSFETLLETLDMIDYHKMHYFVAMPRICHMTKTLYR